MVMSMYWCIRPIVLAEVLVYSQCCPGIHRKITRGQQYFVLLRETGVFSIQEHRANFLGWGSPWYQHSNTCLSFNDNKSLRWMLIVAVTKCQFLTKISWYSREWQFSIWFQGLRNYVSSNKRHLTPLAIVAYYKLNKKSCCFSSDIWHFPPNSC